MRYRYDALGRLTAVYRDGLHTQYHYDAFNRRIKKTTPQGEERYLYIDQNEVGMVDAQGKIVQLRVLGQGRGAEIGAAIAFELEDQIYLPIHDHGGHVILIDFATKKLAEGDVYTAFGQEQRYGPGTSNPWHFSSKRLDPETGWIYFGRRYYDPATGRWTTPDPIGFADGPNLYAYVKNNPLTHFDLYGLRSVPPAAGNAGSGTASAGGTGAKTGAAHVGGHSSTNGQNSNFLDLTPYTTRLTVTAIVDILEDSLSHTFLK